MARPESKQDSGYSMGPKAGTERIRFSISRCRSQLEESPTASTGSIYR